MVFHHFSCMIGNIEGEEDSENFVSAIPRTSMVDATPVEEKKFLSDLDRHLNRGEHKDETMHPNEKAGKIIVFCIIFLVLFVYCVVYLHLNVIYPAAEAIQHIRRNVFALTILTMFIVQT